MPTAGSLLFCCNHPSTRQVFFTHPLCAWHDLDAAATEMSGHVGSGGCGVTDGCGLGRGATRAATGDLGRMGGQGGPPAWIGGGGGGRIKK